MYDQNTNDKKVCNQRAQIIKSLQSENTNDQKFAIREHGNAKVCMLSSTKKKLNIQTPLFLYTHTHMILLVHSISNKSIPLIIKTSKKKLESSQKLSSIFAYQTQFDPRNDFYYSLVDDD